MNTESLILAATILSSSFWGSWHCAAMCGPIASLTAQKKSLLSYHIGRGLSYGLLGAISGYIGSFFLEHDFYVLRIISGVLFGFVLIGMGLNMFFQKKQWSFLQTTWLKKIFNPNTPGLLLGLLSIFLPCGWLYTYAMAAVASKSAFSGSLIMFLFWLGGLPALSAISMFMKKTILLSNQRKQKIAGTVLTLAGIYSLLSFYFMH